MLKSNNFQHYKLSTLSFLNIKIPSFSFLKKAILGLYKNLFWHISRKIGKILENFQKVPFKALLKQQKIFSKSLMKMDRFPKKNFLLKNKIKSISGVFCHIYQYYKGPWKSLHSYVIGIGFSKIMISLKRITLLQIIRQKRKWAKAEYILETF